MPHLLLQLCALAILFAICGFGPGFLVVRRLDWSPAEKIAASFVLSVLALGGASFAIYLLNLPAYSFDAISIACLISIVIARADWRQLLRENEAQRAIALYAAIAAWMIGCIAVIRNFAGGGWAGDWLEHYGRAMFFLHHMPLDTEFAFSSGISSRPPLMNLVYAHFLAATRGGFPAYQVACVLLTSSIAFPVFLIATKIAGTRTAPLAVMIAVIAFNPALVQNTTYPWTKGLAAAFAALAITFYASSWREGDLARFRMAVVAASAAMLTHYSAVAYMGVLAIHFALWGYRRFDRRIAAVEWMVGVPAVVLGSWILWTVHTFGSGPAFGAIGQVRDLQDQTGFQYLRTAAANIFDTFVPYALRGVPLQFVEGDGWTRLHEAAFMLYQANAFLMLGTGALIVLFSSITRRSEVSRESAVLWISFVGIGVIVGIGTVGVPDDYGMAHVSLHPVAVIAVAAAAGLWSTTLRLFRFAAVAGMAIDLALGIGLHLLMEARTFADSPPTGTNGAAGNWKIKHDWHTVYLGDRLASFRWPIGAALAIVGLILLAGVFRTAARQPEQPRRV